MKDLFENSSDDEDNWIPINQAFQQRIVDHCEFVSFNVGIARVSHIDLIRLVKDADLRGLSIRRLVQRILLVCSRHLAAPACTWG